MQHIGAEIVAMLDVLLVSLLAWIGYTRVAVAPSARNAAAGTPASVVKTAAAAPAFQSIAVLPLANEGGDQQQLFFSDGLSEDLITALAQFDQLKVIGRHSAFQFRDSKQDSQTIGAKLKRIFDRIESAPMPFFIKPVAKGIAGKVKAGFITPQINNRLDFLEAELAQRPWFAGSEFTAADIQMSFPIEAAAARAGLAADRPRLMDFLQRIHAREAYQHALQRGGPYALRARSPRRPSA